MPITYININENSKDCGVCHKEIYSEWEKTRHRVAFTNELYKKSHEKEPLIWCLNCHAPFLKAGGNPEKLEDRILKEEGISCLVCHKRGDKILTARIPQNSKEHSYIEVKEMRRSEFCENCHQFNFPVGTGNVPHKDFKFSNQPMQNTFTEWQMSYFFGKETCQDCHMKPKDGYRTHLFPGGHNADYLSNTFFLKLDRISNSEAKIIIIAKHLGHAFPTGDLFRNLVIRLLDRNEKEIKRLNLRYDYTEVEENRFSQTHSVKKLKERNIITPPVAKPDAYYIKNISLSESDCKKIVKYELSMNFTNESNLLFSNLEDNTNKLVFKKEFFLHSQKEKRANIAQ